MHNTHLVCKEWMWVMVRWHWSQQTYFAEYGQLPTSGWWLMHTLELPSEVCCLQLSCEDNSAALMRLFSRNWCCWIVARTLRGAGNRLAFEGLAAHNLAAALSSLITANSTRSIQHWQFPRLRFRPSCTGKATSPLPPNLTVTSIFNSNKGGTRSLFDIPHYNIVPYRVKYKYSS
jgi:hypothetical protein